MYLKRLHLKGFKSFADATDIVFQPGVNVLVGPNGCGKSNVVDAVRWVLGSSRSRELRAQKQEDVIFNGAEGVKAQNMARVEMVLDNQDHVLPLEYNEVGVGRKLFRSGETEFQINQTRVRLKDIGELFNDTGIGKQGYAVIGQGEVEAVLTGKPWERRMMMEEAAGMVRYRQEREEILKRLLHSQNDGVRLQDLLTELKDQLGGLQEKAARAKRYTVLRTERRELVRTVLGAEIGQRQKKLAERKEQVQLLQEQAALWKEQMLEIQGREQGVAQRLEQAQKEEEAAYALLEQKEAVLRDHKTQAGVLQERLRHFEQNVDQLCHEVHQNQQQLERITPDVRTSREDHERRVQEVEEVRNRRLEQERTYQEWTEKLKQEQAALTLEQQQMVEEQGKLGQLAADVEEKRRKLLSLQEEKKYQALRLSEQQEQAEMEGQRLQELMELLQRSREKQAECLQQQKSWEAELGEKRRQYEEHKKQAAENEQLANRLKNQIQLLQQMMENYALHSESVRKFLLAAERGEVSIPGLLGGVSDLIETPQTLALAVETALGGALDHLVTRTAQDASVGIAYLKRTRGGRATFLPLDNLRIQPLSEEWKQKIEQYRGVIGIASDVISCPQEAKPALTYLLGRTVIVENLEDGLKVFRGIRQSIRVVSLEGEVINAGGTMTGGSQAANRSGVLARKARRKQLQKEWREAVHTWDQSVQRFEQTEKAWETFCQEGEELRHRQQELSIRVQSVEERFRQQEKQQQEMLALCQQSQENCQRLTSAIDLQEQALQQMEQAFSLKQEQVQKQAENSGSRQDEFQELQKSCELLKERLKALQEQLQMKEQEAKTREIYWKQLEEIRKSYALAVAQTQEQLEKKRAEQETLQGQLGALREQIAAGEEEVQRQVRALDDLQVALEKMQGQDQDTQGALRPLKEQLERGLEMLHDKQLQQVRLETELESWLEKWMQELGTPWQSSLTEEMHGGELRQKQMRIEELDRELQALGEVDSAAVQEYEEALDRCTFMERQLEDLEQARKKLMQLLRETERRIDQQFQWFYAQLQEKFNETFQRIFVGGQARLEMEQMEDETGGLNRGVEIVVQMPGKKVQNLSLLSGGEKALTGIAFVFALLHLKKAPFCVMDEIDAPLDEANLARFIAFVQQMSAQTQFIIISHRQATIASGAIIYGITMARRGVSRILSLNLEQAVQMGQEAQNRGSETREE